MGTLSMLIPILISLVAGVLSFAATISGTVTDAAGKPVATARIDHTGKTRVVLVRTDLNIPPSPAEIRTDSEGRFRLETEARAFVIRKPGYVSQRIRVDGDARIKVTLSRINATTRCTLEKPPPIKTKQANDIDYTATWYYIETERGPKGVLSGSGPVYTFGGPEDLEVWNSVDYNEFMLDSGVVDAAGHLADETYWRSRSIFGSAAQYYKQTREDAKLLDCVMDRISVK